MEWIAVGSGTNSIAYSSDGLQWFSCGTGPFLQGGRAVASNPGIGNYPLQSSLNINSGNSYQTVGSSYYSESINEDISISTKILNR